jgi:vacuolar-type H+-ATPase subunit D/Vma8
MNNLTDKEQDFLREVDARITKQRSFFSTIIAVLTAAVITLGASNIAGVAANKQRLNAVEHDVKNIKTYYVDVFMFDELVNSIQLYTSHVTALLMEDKEAMKELNKQYKELWDKILYNIQPPATRGGGEE